MGHFEVFLSHPHNDLAELLAGVAWWTSFSVVVPSGVFLGHLSRSPREPQRKLCFCCHPRTPFVTTVGSLLVSLRRKCSLCRCVSRCLRRDLLLSLSLCRCSAVVHPVLGGSPPSAGVSAARRAVLFPAFVRGCTSVLLGSLPFLK